MAVAILALAAFHSGPSYTSPRRSPVSEFSNMAPKKSVEDKIKELALQPSELRLQQSRDLLTHIMNSEPSSVQVMIDACTSHGYDMTMPTESVKVATVAGAKAKSTRTATQEARLAKLRSQTHKSIEKEAEEAGTTNIFNEKYEVIFNFSVAFLLIILETLSPHNLTGANIRKMKADGGSATKTILMEILFASRYPTSPLEGSFQYDCLEGGLQILGGTL